MRQSIHRRIFLITALLLAFSMPVFPRILPLFIVIMALNWLASGVWLTTVPLLIRERRRILTLSLASLYLLYLLGMAWSENMSYGWFDLEVKLSLLVFPLIFSTSDMTLFQSRQMKQLPVAFVAGCLAGALLLLSRSAFFHPAPPGEPVFYYTLLSWYFHPSYLSMYYVFAMIILLSWLVSGYGKMSWLRVSALLAATLLLEAMIILLSSKAGLLSLFTTQALFLFLLSLNAVSRKYILPLFLSFALAGVLFSVVFADAFSRIFKANEMINSPAAVTLKKEDSTLERLFIWKTSAKLIGQHIWYGTGTGDVKDVLIQSYSKGSTDLAAKKRLNAHNQFLQTFLALGLPGILLLLATLGIPAYTGIRKRRYLLFLLVFIISLNLMAESMLETQAGVVFYAFFNTLLFSGCLMNPAGDPFQVGGSERGS